MGFVLISGGRPYVEDSKEPDVTAYGRGWVKLSHKDKAIADTWLLLCKVCAMKKIRVVLEEGLYSFQLGVFTKLL